MQFLTTLNKMRRPSLLRATTSDSEGPSQRQIWLFRLAKFLLVLTFVEDGLRMIIHPVPRTVKYRGTQALVSFAPLAFKLFCVTRQNAVLRRSSFPPL